MTGRFTVRGVNPLDVKLALRMLVRHPALTIVCGAALAIGIPVSLAPIQLVSALNAPMPFENGGGIVALDYWDVTRRDSRNPGLHDFERWRAELTSFDLLVAVRSRTENVVGDTGFVDAVRGSTMTASAFAMTGERPLLGRLLLESDEHGGAEPVVVIGHELWQTFFASAPDVIGRMLRVGRMTRTVVGVMPPGFLFPYRDLFWVPLQERAIDYEIAQAPRVWVFGRLRDGVSRAQAAAEVTAVGQRVAAADPDSYAHLQSRVDEFAYAVTGLRPGPAYPVYLISLLLLAVTCGNVGTLMLARTAARSNEIAVRHALGAGRGRIVTQLFVEALVLALLAAPVGLALAEIVVVRRLHFLELQMPYWFDLSIRWSTLAFTGGLVMFSAVISSLLPALKITGRRAYHSLQRQSTGGSGLRVGAAATVLIVAQVALAVGGLSGVSSVARGAFRARALGDGIAAEEYLTAALRLPSSLPPPAADDAAQAEFLTRFTAIQEEVMRRVRAEPGVQAASFGSVLPGMRHGRAMVEIDASDIAPGAVMVSVVNVAHVGNNFFDALGQPMLLGRTFDTRDLSPRVRPVIVNRSFVQQVLNGLPPIGARFRYVRDPQQPPAPWHEIIGVAGDLGMNIVDPEKTAGLYHVVTPGEINPPHLLVRVSGDASAFVPRLRALVTTIEPEMMLDRPARLDLVFSEALFEARASALVFVLVAVIGVALSAAGLYALMAYSVAQRTREFAIRAALGAPAAHLVGAVVSRALLQLFAGVAGGVCLAVAIIPELLNSFTLAGNWRQMLAAVSLAMIVIGLLACAAPTRRALRIQPIEALKEG